MKILKTLFNKENSLQIAFCLLIPYLLISTGIFSDEFSFMVATQNKKLLELLVPKGFFLVAPVENYTHYIWYHFISIDNTKLISILKILYAFLSLFLLTKFFKLFLNSQNAFLASFIFLFFPPHDTVPFMFLTHYMTLTISFYLFAFYLAFNNKLAWAFIAATVASFTSYASVVIAIALFALFVLKKQYKKGVVIFIPNIIFCTYYIILSRVLDLVKTQIPDRLDIYGLAKQYLLQIVTFLDSTIGPSMWLKLYYSWFELSLISFLIGIFITAIFYVSYEDKEERFDIILLIALFVLLLASFAIFSITGGYPQLAFNMGNRTTVFGSLLLAYLIILLPLSKIKKTVVFSLFLFSILGISDHWKSWNTHQLQVIDNIKNNQALKDYKGDRNIFVSGNQYSKFGGRISHIEFLSENWVPKSIFRLVFEKKMLVGSINKRFKYMDGYLIDTKYNTNMKVENYINVYDSEKDRLFRLDVEKINNYLDSLPPENRHWIMLSDNKFIYFIKSIVLKLMPRLKYAL